MFFSQYLVIASQINTLSDYFEILNPFRNYLEMQFFC